MSDYMREAERLLEDFGHCRVAESILIRCGTPREVSCAKEKVESARAALLAHIQRGAVPEGVGAFRHKETRQVRYTLIGGEHDEYEWEDVLIVPMLAAAPAPDQFRGAAEMVTAQPRVETFDVDFLARLGAEEPAPAEVPMPAKCDGNHGGPQCADPECWNDPVDDVIDVRMAAKRLVKRALAVGVVLTIETQPRQPLAMGNYDLVVETREARKGGAA